MSSNLDQLREWLLAKADEYEDLAPAGQVPFLAVVELHLRFPRLQGFDGTRGVIERIDALVEFEPGEIADQHARRLSRNYPDGAVVGALSEIFNALVADAPERALAGLKQRRPAARKAVTHGSS